MRTQKTRLTLPEFIQAADIGGYIDDLMEQKEPISDGKIAQVAVSRINKRRGDNRRWTIVNTMDLQGPFVVLEPTDTTHAAGILRSIDVIQKAIDEIRFQVAQ